MDLNEINMNNNNIKINLILSRAYLLLKQRTISKYRFVYGYIVFFFFLGSKLLSLIYSLTFLIYLQFVYVFVTCI